MKVDTMRTIDRYVGVPICFGLAIFYKIATWFSSGKKVPVKNALFIELSEMGSAIIADPAMRRLRDEAGAELFFVIFKNNAVSLSLLKTVPQENIFNVRDDNLFTFAVDVLRFLKWCRERHIDTVIDLELFSRATSILTALSGASNRVGFHRGHEEGLYRGSFLTHPVTYNCHIHVARNFMSLILALLKSQGQPPYNKQLIESDDINLAQAEISEAQRDAIRQRMQELYPGYVADQHRLLLVNANASDLLPQRRWMPDRFAAVIKQVLHQYPDVLVVLTGAPAERPQAATICSQVGEERCINSAGFFLFEELLPLYTIATAMLSNDSGPPHFASVTPLKTFVIFGPETPALYGSLGNSEVIYAGLACSPCVSAGNHRKTSCTDNQCLLVITAEHVFQRLSLFLNNIAVSDVG
jgi:ADP-heptose:LPS heptosyltransferase